MVIKFKFRWKKIRKGFKNLEGNNGMVLFFIGSWVVNYNGSGSFFMKFKIKVYFVMCGSF